METRAGTMQPGDRITIERRHGTRGGEIVEVAGAPGDERYLVRWDDGATSYYYPRHHTPTEPSSIPKPRKRSAERPPAEPEPRRITAAPGDRLVIHGHYVDEPGRDAEILEARGRDGGPPFLVRWEDTGRVTLVYPGSDAFIDHLHGKEK